MLSQKSNETNRKGPRLILNHAGLITYGEVFLSALQGLIGREENYKAAVHLAFSTADYVMEKMEERDEESDY